MIRINGVTQVGSIDVDEMFMKGSYNPCLTYVVYSKIKRLYLTPITKDIKNISKLVRDKKMFNDPPYECKLKIKYLLDSIDKFKLDDLNKLLEKKYTFKEFLYQVDAIRKNHTRVTLEKRRARDKVRR